MRAWILAAIIVMGCKKECPTTQCPKVGVREVNGVPVLRIDNADGTVTYMRVEKTWQCEKGDDTKSDNKCVVTMKGTPARVGTPPVCPCDDKQCEPYCHPFPKNIKDIERMLPDFVIDPVPPGTDHPSMPAPPPSDAATAADAAD
jgi:hypothetical protein